MAVDPNAFLLSTAIEAVWSDRNVLDDAAKELIRKCLPHGSNDMPAGEEDLDKLQLALSATDFLESLSDAQIVWLSNDAQGFPAAVRKLIYRVALEFHDQPQGLPGDFIAGLTNHLKRSQSHVATLNYDDLLYKPLVEKEVLKGYDGDLVDGFLSDGFTPENLERRYNHKFGYYLHLHGSPLFIDKDEKIVKLKKSEVREDRDRLSSHLVLTHVKHKPTVIDASPLLTEYWGATSIMHLRIRPDCALRLLRRRSTSQ